MLSNFLACLVLSAQVNYFLLKTKTYKTKTYCFVVVCCTTHFSKHHANTAFVEDYFQLWIDTYLVL